MVATGDLRDTLVGHRQGSPDLDPTARHMSSLVPGTHRVRTGPSATGGRLEVRLHTMHKQPTVPKSRPRPECPGPMSLLPLGSASLTSASGHPGQGIHRRVAWSECFWLPILEMAAGITAVFKQRRHWVLPSPGLHRDLGRDPGGRGSLPRRQLAGGHECADTWPVPSGQDDCT